MKNFQYVMERFSTLLREWIIQHTKEGMTEFDIKYQLEKLIGQFQVDLFFDIRDHLHMGKIDINVISDLDNIIYSFYMKRVYPQLTSCV